MAAALTITLERPGAVLGSLLLTGADQQVNCLLNNRQNGIIQVYALDAASDPANFQWANPNAGNTAAATYTPTFVGAPVQLPVYAYALNATSFVTPLGQSYYFKALTGAPTVYFVCVG